MRKTRVAHKARIEIPAGLLAAGRLLPYGNHCTSTKPHFNLPFKISNSSGKITEKPAQKLPMGARLLPILTVTSAALTVPIGLCHQF